MPHLVHSNPRVNQEGSAGCGWLVVCWKTARLPLTVTTVTAAVVDCGYSRRRSWNYNRCYCGWTRSAGHILTFLNGRTVWSITLRANQELNNVVEAHIVIKQRLAILHLQQRQQEKNQICFMIIFLFVPETVNISLTQHTYTYLQTSQIKLTVKSNTKKVKIIANKCTVKKY